MLKPCLWDSTGRLERLWKHCLREAAQAGAAVCAACSRARTLESQALVQPCVYPT